MYKYTEEELLEKFAEIYEHFKAFPLKNIHIQTMFERMKKILHEWDMTRY
jgi:hypothetical protein